MKELDLDLSGSQVRTVWSIEGHRIPCYGEQTFSVASQDRDGLWDTQEMRFCAAEIKGYDLVLGYLWLRQVNPDIDWPLASYRHRKSQPRIVVEDQKTFLNHVQEEGWAYAMYATLNTKNGD